MPIETTTKEHSSSGVVAAAPWRLRSVSVLPGYRLSVSCNDGTSGIVDMSKLVSSESAGIYATLKDECIFNQATIELGVLTWPTGADLDPEWVHEELGKNKTWSIMI